MRWFEGNIPTAIQNAKTKGMVFMVYITGQDEISKKMDETWDNEEVSAACEQSCVGLKIEAKSDTCVQFSQIYPVVLVPSTYFIATTGVPLEVTGGYVEPADLINNIHKVAQLHNNGPQSTPSETTPAKEPLETPQTSEEQASSSASNIPTEEKVARAQEMIVKKREQKAKEESEKELDSEIQRRQLGKESAKLKQWQEDKARQEVADSWKKEREEAKIAKERVREQIARDRAERQAKFQQDKNDRLQEEDRKKEAKESATAQAKAQSDASRRETARLQFRLPDGSSINETFASSETLGTAKIFLKAKIGGSYGNFSMMTTYPRREFKESDMSASLLDLQLAPSAVIVVIPEAGSPVTQVQAGPEETGSKAAPSSGQGGSDGGILAFIFAPLLLLWNYIYNLIFGAPRITAQQESSPNTDPSTNTQSSSQSEQSSEDSSTLRSRSQQSKGLASRQEGNVRRFTANDDDDDMTVYNGNSTQQM